MRVTVDHTWDGVPLAEPAATLTITPGPRTWRITVEAPYRGDPAPSGPPGPTDQLWEHEVVELFVVGDALRYTEIELGPHGHHLVLRLEGVRRPVAKLLPMTFVAEIDGDRWRGVAELDATLLPEPRAWNAYAIWGRGAGRRYAAAVPLPGPHPDFHQPERFATWPST